MQCGCISGRCATDALFIVRQQLANGSMRLFSYVQKARFRSNKLQILFRAKQLISAIVFKQTFNGGVK